MNLKEFLELPTFAIAQDAPEETKEQISIYAETPDGKKYDIGPITLTSDGSMAPKLSIRLREIKSVLSEPIEMAEEIKLSPFRNGKQGYWSAPLCKITDFEEYLDRNEPIIGGNWNPNDYIDDDRYTEMIEWFEENGASKCLNESDEENILWASMGTTFENEETQEHCVDIFEVVNNWIEDFAGRCVDSHQTKAPAFGYFGIGRKYFAVYYYECGAIIIKGEGNEFGNRSVKFVMFFPKSIWKAMKISPVDVTQ
jgi:hypothetical protein